MGKVLVRLCALLFLLVPLGLALAPTWVVASAVTSAVKTLNKDCGKRYPVEVVLSGNFFCSTESNK